MSQEPSTSGSTIENSDDQVALYRGDIDRIDRTIVALLAERMRLGIAVGAIKRALDRPFRSPVREAEVLAHARRAASGALSPESAERIFHVIIEETSACQTEDGQEHER
jgi:chorismate mutase